MPETTPTGPAESPNNRILAVAAWSLVAVAMFLAAIVTMTGLARVIVDANPPVVATVQPAPDTIAPPVELQAPCNPIFQRCEGRS